ncbi:TPA: hypothetical protein ACG3JX_003847 [Clostridioides difficile]
MNDGINKKIQSVRKEILLITKSVDINSEGNLALLLEGKLSKIKSICECIDSIKGEIDNCYNLFPMPQDVSNERYKIVDLEIILNELYNNIENKLKCTKRDTNGLIKNCIIEIEKRLKL